MSIAEISKERGYVEGTIINHIEQLLEQFPDLSIGHLVAPKNHITLVEKYLPKIPKEDQGKLAPLKSLLEKSGHKLSWDDIRLARLFVTKS